MKRRTVIKGLGIAGLAVASQSIQAPYVWARGSTFEWQMATSWSQSMPILQTGAERFAKRVAKMSQGKLKIKVFYGGQHVESLKVFDAVSKGTVECGHSASFYWADKVPASQWFTSVPFGLKALEMNTWYYNGGARELWQEVYEPYGIVPMLAGNTGIQMGGWFNRKIHTEKDFAGLRMRIPGLGGKVLSKLDTEVVLLPGGEIVQALKEGKINAAEWIGPYHDMGMGFPQVAKYYYGPGWHDLGTAFEMMFNRKALERLPQELKTILEVAAEAMNQEIFSTFEHQNKLALFQIAEERIVQLRLFPHQVLRVLERLSREVLEEEANKDAITKKVHQAYKKFKKSMRQFALLRGAEMRI